MRRLTPFLLAALVLAAIQPAEARRVRGVSVFAVHTGTGPAPARPRPAPERAREPAIRAGWAPPAALRPSLAPSGEGAAVAAVAGPAAAPWCAVGRVVGGFCIVN